MHPFLFETPWLSRYPLCQLFVCLSVSYLISSASLVVRLARLYPVMRQSVMSHSNGCASRSGWCSSYSCSFCKRCCFGLVWCSVAVLLAYQCMSKQAHIGPCIIMKKVFNFMLSCQLLQCFQVYLLLLWQLSITFWAIQRSSSVVFGLIFIEHLLMCLVSWISICACGF